VSGTRHSARVIFTATRGARIRNDAPPQQT